MVFSVATIARPQYGPVIGREWPGYRAGWNQYLRGPSLRRDSFRPRGHCANFKGFDGSGCRRTQ
jgi:hypothetical protein